MAIIGMMVTTHWYTVHDGTCIDSVPHVVAFSIVLEVIYAPDEVWGREPYNNPGIMVFADLVQLCDELPDVGVHPEGEEEDAGQLAE